ncbi:MAG: asparaginase domain-containing protein [Burkholderiaceae bacterium]
MTLRLIAAGGTFDKVYDPIQGTLVFERTTLPDIAARARLGDAVVIDELMQIDSLDMDDGHRQRLLAACRLAPERRIVVVHGTDTMVRTARVLASARLDKTIVLTGAMIPYRVAGSDAMFNLGHAIAAAAHAAPGVYVAMNGRTWPWDRVRKNRDAGRFESAEPDAPDAPAGEPATGT